MRFELHDHKFGTPPHGHRCTQIYNQIIHLSENQRNCKLSRELLMPHTWSLRLPDETLQLSTFTAHHNIVVCLLVELGASLGVSKLSNAEAVGRMQLFAEERAASSYHSVQLQETSSRQQILHRIFLYLQFAYNTARHHH